MNNTSRSTGFFDFPQDLHALAVELPAEFRYTTKQGQ
jgi:hypothetical protein